MDNILQVNQNNLDSESLKTLIQLQYKVLKIKQVIDQKLLKLTGKYH